MLGKLNLQITTFNASFSSSSKVLKIIAGAFRQLSAFSPRCDLIGINCFEKAWKAHKFYVAHATNLINRFIKGTICEEIVI